MGFSSEQILALAPDSASAAAGRGLANAAKWQNLGASERALWGECKGSGAKPYQAQMDIAGPAFKCSCPSRKFPCKHGLGLGLLYAAKPELFGLGEPPAWVAEWLNQRDGREQKRTEATDAPPPLNDVPPEAEPTVPGATKGLADPDAQAKRIAERERKVAAGVAELEIWLQDVMRGGLVLVRGQGYKYFDAMAARLVDAQAAGLARMVKQLGSDAVTAGWQDALLGGLGRLQLLCDAYRRLPGLPPDVAQDVRALIGWTQREEDLKDSPGVRDHWYVAGSRITEEENLRVARTWLFGNQTGRRALVLQFAHGSQAPPALLQSGQWLDAELAFYPGRLPLRAIIVQSAPSENSVAAALTPPAGSVAQARAEQTAALARLPWSSAWPVAVGPAVLLPADIGWRLRDELGEELIIRDAAQNLWTMLAAGGGAPLTLFGILDGVSLMPCGFSLSYPQRTASEGGSGAA